MKIYEAIAKAVKILEENEIEDASLKARYIMQDYLSKSKEELIRDKDTFDTNGNNFYDYFEKIEMVKNNIPYEYVIGKAYFFGEEYFVNENTLIPRLDTEILVDEALKKVDEIKGIKKINILEIGVGTGIISITLALNKENLNILGVDISNKALEVANLNLNRQDKKMRIEEKNSKIKFIISDIYSEILENIKEENEKEIKFDIIISNPPYIKSNVMKELNKDVLKEPYLALDGGEDGLIFYDRIIKDSKKYLKEDGYILFEIGYDQKEDLLKLAEKYGYEKENVSCIRDFENRDRVIIIKNSRK